MRCVLAGDIGGTKTILAMAEAADKDIVFLHLARFESRAYASLEAIVEEFLSRVSLNRAETVVSFGIAGAVRNGRCRTTNLPWTVDEKKIESELSLRKASLINDFTATILGIPFLKDQDKAVLNKGVREISGPIAVLGAGTGLGEGAAFYSPAEKGYQVIPSEGGHASFSPANDEEMELLRYLKKKLGHVSFERLLSGQGIVNIFNFLAHASKEGVSDSMKVEMKSGDPAAVITKYAMEGSDELSKRTLDLFLSIYGTEAGNVALKFLPYGGLYIGGGIAPKIASKFREDVFMKAFLNKGRMTGLLERIPVELILREEVGLLGAVVHGRKIMSLL